MFLPTLILLAVVLAPLPVASLSGRSIQAVTGAVTGAQLSASPSKSQQTSPIDEELSNAERAIMFSIATAKIANRTPSLPEGSSIRGGQLARGAENAIKFIAQEPAE
jgi:hypothetical protein